MAFNNFERRSEIPESLDSQLTVALYATFKAGSAGVGWPADKDRMVRIPYVKLANAIEEFYFVVNGRARVSGLQDCPTPDHVRVVIEPYNARPYNARDCSPFIGTYLSFTTKEI